MAYGGPSSLEDVEPYLADIFQGRPIPSSVVSEICNRYNMIGGRSPILEITRSQGVALEEKLKEEGLYFPVEIGMRHWAPRIKEGVSLLAGRGVRKIIAIPMTPYYSKLSMDAYKSIVEQACNEMKVSLICVKEWHLHPFLIKAFAERVREAAQPPCGDLRQSPFLLFTAHSIPCRGMGEEFYANSIKETAEAVTALLGKEYKWSISFQSQGKTRSNASEKWLGPAVEETLEKLHAAGEDKVLLIPIGFLCDHVEILYDIDIAFQQLAKQNDMVLCRTGSLNIHPFLIDALLSLVKDAALKETA